MNLRIVSDAPHSRHVKVLTEDGVDIAKYIKSIKIYIQPNGLLIANIEAVVNIDAKVLATIQKKKSFFVSIKNFFTRRKAERR